VNFKFTCLQLAELRVERGQSGQETLRLLLNHLLLLNEAERGVGTLETFACLRGVVYRSCLIAARHRVKFQDLLRPLILLEFVLESACFKLVLQVYLLLKVLIIHVLHVASKYLLEVELRDCLACGNWSFYLGSLVPVARNIVWQLLAFIHQVVQLYLLALLGNSERESLGVDRIPHVWLFFTFAVNDLRFP